MYAVMSLQGHRTFAVTILHENYEKRVYLNETTR